MKIAIIGHGNVGGALAKRWAAAGHEVLIGARNPQDEKVQNFIAAYHIPVRDITSAVNQAEVILVATPAHIAVALAQQFGQIPDKIIIDATNAIRQKPEPYKTAFEAFQQITGAQLAKCFNTTGYENIENPVYDAVGIDLFTAGSSAKAKATAIRLAKDAGFGECYDFGGDERVELLEQFALAWINLAIFQNHGRNIAFKLLKR
ncbi:MAG: NADPH-dependent F420 reductase [Saprospiraceae bacterium]